MLVNAIITAKEIDVGLTTTFGAEIVPPHVGDTIMWKKKPFTVTASKQEITSAGNIVFHVCMEYKEDPACLFK